MPTRFKIPDGFERTQFDAMLAKRYEFLTEAPRPQSWIIYDTFDCRLFAKSLTLRWSGQDLILCTLLDGETLHNLPAASTPRFARDLPDGLFREQLHAIIKERALLDLAAANTWSYTYRILNKDKKTVARLVYTELRPNAAEASLPLASFLTVQPLRGYDNQARRLATYLQKSLPVACGNEGITFSALQAAGRTPGAYSGKLNVHLEANMPAAEATKIILRHLLKTMRANEAGIEADIDIEFLHDYRIAVRRTRSALSQIRQVFPARKTDHYKRELRALGKLTNDLRDLDVYLLAEADFRAMLPDAMQADIAPLFDYLRSHRADALDEVIAGLESKTYARMISKWETFLNKPVKAKSARNATVPIIDLARKRINNQYCRVVRDGNTILEHTEDELLHALRIECKKLRYLLEFFASIFPSKEIARMVKQLKRLQDNLGEFTDLSVQQEYLLSIAEALDIDEAQARRSLVATGFLVETMARRQQRVKADFAGTFKQFASPKHQKQFQRLFAKGKKVKS
ncbi:MAG: CHAD domain-containing protein [Chloroflexi bacterium]|nr:CHAD domain-containing protein [Chloroflexota bacterium]